MALYERFRFLAKELRPSDVPFEAALNRPVLLGALYSMQGEQQLGLLG